MMADILIIDDNKDFCDVLSHAITSVGHTSTFVLTLREGIRNIFDNRYDVVLLDVQLPDGNGLEAVERIKGRANAPEVIIMTGSGDPDGAELAIRCGAWDYIEKPSSLNGIILPVLRAIEYRKQKDEKSETIVLDRNRIVGDSTPMQTCYKLLAQAARTDMSVLLEGETGTGKELFARTLHQNSRRADKPFIIVDCSVLPESLVESILFGFEKGAFTGADRKKDGLIKQADGGTLFLDEIGELPLSIQKSFLRVLQDGYYRPIGSRTEESSNFRLVAATNRSLEHMAASGLFRPDLLFRIGSMVIKLPSLKERGEDITQLTIRYVSRACSEFHITAKGFSPEFFDVLQEYKWPGNVRELFNALQSALAAAQDESILYPTHLPVDIRAKVARASLRGKDSSTAATGYSSRTGSEVPAAYKDFRSRLLEDGERQYFKQVISHSGGNVSDACRISGLSKSRFYYFLQKYDLHLVKGLSNPKAQS
jgi:two-component system, NtrC family, response regulator